MNLLVSALLSLSLTASGLWEGCYYDGTKLQCTEGGKALTALPKLVAPEHLSAQENLFCVKDAEGRKCFGRDIVPPLVAGPAPITAFAVWGDTHYCAVSEGTLACHDGAGHVIPAPPLADVSKLIVTPAGSFCAATVDKIVCWQDGNPKPHRTIDVPRLMDFNLPIVTMCWISRDEQWCENPYGGPPLKGKLSGAGKDFRKFFGTHDIPCVLDGNRFVCVKQYETKPYVMREDVADAAGGSLWSGLLLTTSGELLKFDAHGATVAPLPLPPEAAEWHNPRFTAIESDMAICVAWDEGRRCLSVNKGWLTGERFKDPRIWGVVYTGDPAMCTLIDGPRLMCGGRFRFSPPDLFTRGDGIVEPEYWNSTSGNLHYLYALWIARGNFLYRWDLESDTTARFGPFADTILGYSVDREWGSTIRVSATAITPHGDESVTFLLEKDKPFDTKPHKGRMPELEPVLRELPRAASLDMKTIVAWRDGGPLYLRTDGDRPVYLGTPRAISVAPRSKVCATFVDEVRCWSAGMSRRYRIPGVGPVVEASPYDSFFYELGGKIHLWGKEGALDFTTGKIVAGRPDPQATPEFWTAWKTALAGAPAHERAFVGAVDESLAALGDEGDAWTFRALALRPYLMGNFSDEKWETKLAAIAGKAPTGEWKQISDDAAFLGAASRAVRAILVQSERLLEKPLRARARAAGEKLDASSDVKATTRELRDDLERVLQAMEGLFATRPRAAMARPLVDYLAR